VAVVRSPAGEAREVMHFPFDDLELDNRLKDLQIALLRSGGRRRTVLSREEQAVQDFGRILFDALLTGEVGRRYDVSMERARRAGQGLRLRLRIQPPEMILIPAGEFLMGSDPQKDPDNEGTTTVVGWCGVLLMTFSMEKAPRSTGLVSGPVPCV